MLKLLEPIRRKEPKPRPISYTANAVFLTHYSCNILYSYCGVRINVL